MADNSTQCICIVIGAVFGIGIILTIILVPMSFSGLEFFEYGFVRQKSTGTVETDKAYSGGKYMIGPDYEFKIFPADAKFVQLHGVSVFTYNTLEIHIDVYFQYFLRQEDLPILHKNYDINYEYVIEKSAIAALKAEAPKHATWDYILERKKVEAALFKAVRERLGGTCCAENCDWKYACPTGCIAADVCDQDNDKGLWVDVKYLQLGSVNINNEVMGRYLQTMILRENAAREKMIQEAQVVRKKTVAAVKKIQNEALEIRQLAYAKSKLINRVSQANYTMLVENARAKGLKNLYEQLNLDDQDSKSSFDYLRTLRGLDNIHLTVDFQQRIVGGMGSN